MLHQVLWDAVEIVAKEAQALPPAPSVRKRDLVHLAVFDFASRAEVRGVLLLTPDLPAPILAPLRGRGTVTSLPDRGDGRGPTQVVRVAAWDPDLKRAVVYVRGNPQLEAIHARFVADLDAIVAGKVSAELLGRIAAHKPVIVVESHALEGRRLVESRRDLLTSLEAALTYVLARLLSVKQRGKASDLRRCKLPTCRDFFFCSEASGERGAPRTSFCSAKHAEDHRRLTVKERVRKHRAEKARKAAAGK